MENEKYYQAFRDLGIKVEPLPSNYNPEEYGRRLLSMSQSEYGVSYAASTSTDYVVIKQNNAKKWMRNNKTAYTRMIPV